MRLGVQAFLPHLPKLFAKCFMSFCFCFVMIIKNYCSSIIFFIFVELCLNIVPSPYFQYVKICICWVCNLEATAMVIKKSQLYFMPAFCLVHYFYTKNLYCSTFLLFKKEIFLDTRLQQTLP